MTQSILPQARAAFQNLCDVVFDFDGKKQVMQKIDGNLTQVMSFYDPIRDADKTDGPAWLKEIFTENPDLKSRIAWEDASHRTPEYRAAQIKQQAASDRATFDRYAIRNGLSSADANFDIAKSIGPGFTDQDLDQVKDRMFGATAAESQKRQADAAATHQAYINSLPAGHPDRVKAIAESRQQSQQSFVQQQDQHERQRSQALGLPPLPQTTPAGEKIDPAYLNKVSIMNREEFRRLIKVHGGVAVVDRMRGIA